MREDILIVRTPIHEEELRKFLGRPFPEMVKLVVDVEREILTIGGELHSDAEELLLDDGSRQEDSWGCNFYPDLDRARRLDYSALINIRPSQNNRSLEVQDPEIRERIRAVVQRLIIESPDESKRVKI
jgi:hypothetical protein